LVRTVCKNRRIDFKTKENIKKDMFIEENNLGHVNETGFRKENYNKEWK